MKCLVLLMWICSPSLIIGFGVQLDGLIDLGPKWSYKYKLSPLSTTELFVELPKVSYSQKGRKDNEVTINSTGNVKDKIIPLTDNLQFKDNIDSVHNLSTVTQIIKSHKDNIHKIDITKKSDARSQTNQKIQQNANKKLKKKIINNTQANKKSKESDKGEINTEGKKTNIGRENVIRDQKIKDKLHEFTMHVYKQSLKVWENMVKITNREDMKKKMKIMKNHYKKMFGLFIRQSKKHKLKTKLGSQRFILNTIDTSNRIMQRLVNSLSTYENFISSRSKAVSIFQREIDKEQQLEYAHACKKFNVCRTRDDFSEYLIELLNIVIQTDYNKIKQASDALTEVIKTNDFTETIDGTTQDKIRKQMADIELMNPYSAKAMFVILRNVLSHKNQPLIIMNAVDQHVANKTVAFHEVVDTLNKNIHKSANIPVWNDIKKQLEEWGNGTGKEITSTFQSLINMIKTGMKKLDSKATQEFNKNLNIIMKPFSKIFGI